MARGAVVQARRMTQRADFDAVLFDLDGVLTATAALHAAAWKQTFDELLAERSRAPFDVERDYVAHVDGKPREDGVRDFLAARGIELAESRRARHRRPQAGARRAGARRRGRRGVPGLGALGARAPRRRRAHRGRLVEHELPRRAARRGIDELFDEIVDGGDVARLGLRGKPAPDGFLEAAARLARQARRARRGRGRAGRRRGRAGGRLRPRVGVARSAAPAALLPAGADMVVDDLAEMVR